MVPGIPADFRVCLDIQRNGPTWSALSPEGIVIGVGGSATPQLLAPAGPTDFRAMTQVRAGVIVAGNGTGYIYRDGEWQSLDTDDLFWSAATDGRDAILVGTRSIYVVDEAGRPQRVMDLHSEHAGKVVKMNGVLVVFAGTDGIFAWENRTLVPYAQRLPWAKKTLRISSVQMLPSGESVFATDRGAFVVKGTEATQILKAEYKANLSSLMINLTVFGDTAIVSTFYGGLKAYSLESSKELWHIPTDKIGGSVYCVEAHSHGLLIGSTNGIYSLPDPNLARFSALPAGEIIFVEAIEDGEVLLGLSTGTYKMAEGCERLPETIYSILRTGQGTRVEGQFGKLSFNGQTVSIGGRDVQKIVSAGRDMVAVMQPHAISLVSQSGQKLRIDLPSTHNSLVSTERELLVGTQGGGVVLDHDGKILRQITNRRSRVFRLGDQVVVFSSGEGVYNPDGQFIGPVPAGEIVDVVLWKGSFCALVRFEDNEQWVMLYNKEEQNWFACDLPLPIGASKLLESQGHLLVFSPGRMLRAYSAPMLSPPDVSAAGVSADIAAVRVNLSTEQSSTDFDLPSLRVPPWKNPTYSVLADGELIYRGGPGSLPRGTRFQWGETAVEVRAQWANLTTSKKINVHRVPPWWMRPHAYLLYVAAGGILGYFLIRTRTRRLEHKARRLQDLVDSRTVELRTAQKAREEFFSTLSHEIRNPLNGVVGLCEIVEADKQNVAVTERGALYVRTLKGCADQLRSILDDVLDFSRIDRGEIQISPSPMEITSVVEGGVRSIDATLKHCSIETPAGPYWVVGDAGRIRQVVANLVSNALKFGEPAKAEVQVRAEVGQDGKIHVSVSVLNRGPTIPSDELAAIFGGFVRGSEAKKRRIAGSGIGLAVSRRLAEAMGGTLEARTEAGTTEFTLQLRLEPTEKPTTEPPPACSPASRRALAIEDETYNRMVLQHTLEQLGFEADWAETGEQALKLAASKSYDVILTDLALPDVDGITLAQRLLAQVPEPKPPIIAVTAYCTPEKIQQARNAGITGFLTKPVSARKLSELLAN